MFLNYIKIAIRVFGRNKLISIINLLGLSLGIAIFAISIFYVDYEYNYENFQLHNKKIYRICPDKEFVGTPPALGRLIGKDFPEVESVTRIGRSSWSEKVTVKAKNNYYYEDLFFFVDSSFFQTFDYELLLGNKEDVLTKPFSVVINEKTALKYFNKKDAIGEVIEFDKKNYTITGIAKDVPPNSHFHFDIISPFHGTMDYMYADLKKYWGSYNYFTYVKFKENISVKDFQNKLIDYATEEYKDYNGIEFFKNLYFQPIKQAHIEVIRGNLEAPVNKKYLLIYIFVAIVILVVASINYVNLSIAASLRRAKEVGLRKVVGADRYKIRNQFLSESVLFTIFSLALSFVLIESFIPLLNLWFELNIFIDYLDWRFIVFSLIIIIWVGFISGSYPAFVVSRLQPIKVLKSGFGGNKANTAFRNALMVIQFVISICLIVGALFITKQMNYVDNLDLGFNRHGVVNIPLHDNRLKEKGGIIKQEFAKNSEIIDLSSNSFNITDQPFHQTIWYEKENEVEQDMVWFLLVDRDFFKTYKITILQGSTFPQVSFENPTAAYVINRSAAVTYFGDENPIGKRLSMRGEKNMGYVAGVVDDFNFRSLHYAVEPLVFSLDPYGYDYLSLRIDPEKSEQTMNFIESKWTELYPNYPLEVQFVDNEYKKLYKAESQTGSLILVFTMLSILISCMGLFGINSLITKYRIREISVRKVFGASVSRVVLILSSNIAKLVLIANIIAWPLSYYIMDNWLNNFTYRIQMNWYVFILAGLMTLIISLLTVSAQAIKAANTNPSETLKFE